MDFNKLIETAENASAFELWRMYCAFSRMMEDPKKIMAARSQLRPGMDISYFERRDNCLIDAVVIELGRTRVLVQNKNDGKPITHKVKFWLKGMYAKR